MGKDSYNLFIDEDQLERVLQEVIDSFCKEHKLKKNEIEFFAVFDEKLEWKALEQGPFLVRLDTFIVRNKKKHLQYKKFKYYKAF